MATLTYGTREYQIDNAAAETLQGNLQDILDSANGSGCIFVQGEQGTTTLVVSPGVQISIFIEAKSVARNSR